jgi:hypothetical protein
VMGEKSQASLRGTRPENVAHLPAAKTSMNRTRRCLTVV